MIPADYITSLKGIGPRKAESLGRLGLFSLKDLLYFFPRGHRDYSRPTYIMGARHGDEGAFELTVRTEPKLARIRRGLDITTAKAYDQSGEITLTWYNQPYRKGSISAGDKIVACGRVDRSRGVRLVNPAVYRELPGILPVYPLTAGVTQAMLRDAVRAALEGCIDGIEETLPGEIRAEYSLMGIADALKNIHYPSDMEAVRAARRRLAFEDMLLFRLMLSMMQREMPKRTFKMKLDGIREEFVSLLPFPPTNAQLRAMDDIAGDLDGKTLMNRLLQGDVGSGKTAVAMFAMFAAAKNGRQAAIMAPTEILAAQHSATLCRTFGEGSVAFLRGGMKKAEREREKARIASGEAKYIVGTHALLQGDVEFFDLGMVITDEQHRFGVGQRAAMGAKGRQTDVLIMSATPIPRTLSLILYGDLSVSDLDELPPGRKRVATRLVPEHRREDMYRFIEEQARAGFQAYVVCPLVESSDSLEGVQSAEELYGELKDKLSVSVGLLHGQMSPAQKEKAAAAFRAGETKVLVATTVIEVGVDVPNATIMAIENADRFGLAQLHQLRGRVGRGSERSYCFLLSRGSGEAAEERLRTLVKTGNGFVIAQKDLEMRGPGEFLGKRQHGLNEFAAASLALDIDALQAAQKAADAILENPENMKRAAGLLERAREKLALMDGEIARN
ncbi:MAG: ATP-dependent DNA helicase RecG [Clostridia bacterium]|nr:ATP-dependent DNA helicase RecG [Clostridia bacterium]